MGGCVRQRLRRHGSARADRRYVLSLSLCADRRSPCRSRGRSHPPPKSSPALGWRTIQRKGYVGAGFAFGKGLYAPGLRLRAVGAFGGYDYQERPRRAGADFTFDGQDAFGAALIGYQFGAARRSSQASLPASKARTRTSRPTIPTIRCKAAPWACASKPRAGSIFPRAASSPSMRPMARPSRNIGVSRASATACGLGLPWAWKAALLGNEEYDAGRGGGFFRFISATELTFPAASPAIFWMMSRAATSCRHLPPLLS